MPGAYTEILLQILSALNWKGSKSDLMFATPCESRRDDLSDFRAVMVNLGYASKVVDKGDRLTFPAIGVCKDKEPVLLTTKKSLSENAGRFSFFLTFSPAEPPLMPKNGEISLREELRRFSPVLHEVVLLSLVIGFIALSPIFFNRALYDHIMASGSDYGLPMLITGAMLALVAEIFLREWRGRRLARFGGRIDHFVSCSVFERLLFLPPMFTERSAVSAQIARLRDFENVREFFTGPLATLLFEIPLILIYLLVMGFVGKWLVLVPFVLLMAYGILIFAMLYRMQELSKSVAASSSRRQEFLLETLAKLHDIRAAGMEKVWNERFRRISGEASMESFRYGHAAQILETLSYILMSMGGVATLAFGVSAVIEGALSVGALIAAMMLIWRIIAPMQIFCASITRMQQLRSSVGQVKRLLSLLPEQKAQAVYTPVPKIEGRITFHRVSLRYSPESEPALLGVSLEATPGQIVAIRGANGSGKSTILKLVLGLYRPQNGSVRIDGVDIRQYDPVVLRRLISYVPQYVDLFPGTIRQNLLFANPAASEEDCLRALEDSCALADLENLRQGLDTPIEAENMPFLLKQRINLARAYLRPASIMLFDEASHSLGRENDIAFERKLNELRGQTTVLLVTHREDHMRMADQLLVMNKGELTYAGPPDQVLAVLRGK